MCEKIAYDRYHWRRRAGKEQKDQNEITDPTTRYKWVRPVVRAPITVNKNGDPVTPKEAKNLDFKISQFPVSCGKKHEALQRMWDPVITSTSSYERPPPPNEFAPGQFSGLIEVERLSYYQLTAGPQPWTRKRQLIEAPPLDAGPGKEILQKYGWEPGNGLGRNRKGALEPLLVEVKLDKRGLGADGMEDQTPPKKIKLEVSTSNTSLVEKNSISLLHELSSKKKWGVPVFEVHSESGPAHNKTFIFKVTIKGVEYICPTGRPTKKEAKEAAAKFCLEKMAQP